MRLSVAAPLIASVLTTHVSHAAQPMRSMWDGVYSSDQAQRGNTEFAARCAMCHGETLAGNGSVPPLSGRPFLYNWDGLPLASLFDRIHQTMPQNAPGSLSARTAADLTAYILYANRVPSGSRALPDDDQSLQSIRFDAHKPD